MKQPPTNIIPEVSAETLTPTYGSKHGSGIAQQRRTTGWLKILLTFDDAMVHQEKYPLLGKGDYPTPSWNSAT